MRPPVKDPAWPEDVVRLYAHDMQEIWDRTIAPQVWIQYHGQLDLYLSLVPSQPSLRILDVGCAQATLALLLAERGHDVTAVDLRSQFLDYARTRHTRGSIRFVCADVLELDLPERFDVIFANQILEHVVRPVALVERLCSHLAPGGRVIATTPNGRYVRNSLPSFRDLGDPERHAHRSHSADGDGHFFAYRPAELREILLAAGLHDVHVKAFETPWVSGHMKVRHLQRITPSWLLRALDRALRSVPGVGTVLSHQLLATGHV
jgi:2-polyprenyl-3-methyl-5-hydroxy-6-metoxy-1,4-benzoquinol methylase